MLSKKNYLIHIFFLIISAGLYYYGIKAPDLTWNMLLALAALDFAILTKHSKSSVIKITAGIFWLFFYPNTFYMVTDIVHMHFTSTVLWQRESMILFMLYVPSIFYGVMTGVESVRLMFTTFSIKSYWLRLFLIGSLSLLSSFAIHIGRYARLNSWDIFIRPNVVVSEMFKAISWNALPFIIGFTFIQIMVLVFSIDE